MSVDSYFIAVVGGGASGYAAAISAARIFVKQRRPVRIAIIEKQTRSLKKLLATGNGRCNLSNINLSSSYYYGDRGFYDEVLSQRKSDTVSFFESLGLVCKEEEGRIYPYSDTAASVVDVLRFEADDLGISLITDCEAEIVRIYQGSFHIECSMGNEIKADKLIVATGGAGSPSLGGARSGYSLLKQLGHRITPIYPSLVQLIVDSPFPRQLKGIRIKGKVSLEFDGELQRELFGEVLFTEYGLSGIAIMQISRQVAEVYRLKEDKAIVVSIDLMFDYDEQKVFVLLARRIKDYPQRSLDHIFTGILHKRIGQALLKYADIGPVNRKIDTLTRKELQQLTEACKRFTFRVVDTQGFSSAQSTAGGAQTDDFERTLESKISKGLYACGEILDVDGDCGGYNLDWAWTSGRIAGENAARAYLFND